MVWKDEAAWLWTVGSGIYLLVIYTNSHGICTVHCVEVVVLWLCCALVIMLTAASLLTRHLSAFQLTLTKVKSVTRPQHRHLNILSNRSVGQ